MTARLLLAALLFASAAPAAAVKGGDKARAEARRFGLDQKEPRVRRAARGTLRRDFERFKSSQGGAWRLRVDPRTGGAAGLSGGRTRPRRGRRAEDAAREFLGSEGALLGIDPAVLSFDRERKGKGARHVLFRQKHRGLPVEFAAVKVHLDDAGAVEGVDAKWEPDLSGVPTTPTVPGAAAGDAAGRDAGGQAYGEPELVILPLERTGRAHLAWKVRVRAPLASWRYYVDAHTGQVLFRYNNLRFAPPVCLTSGVVAGMVYDIDPTTTPVAVRRPFDHLDVYVADASTFSTTYTDSAYGSGFFCNGVPGKVSMSLQGPYVNVSNFRTASAHYDNGDGVWSTLATPVSSPHPYANSTVHVATINLTGSVPTNQVKFLPVFSAFNVGGFSGESASDIAGGDITDDDQVTLYDGRDRAVASYLGNRGAFRGAAVHGKVMHIGLKSNEAGTQTGYDVILSSYLTVTSPFTYGASGSSHTWTAANTFLNLSSEMHLFYHLNAMHDYFFTDVNRSSAAPVTRPLVAMAHVGPNMVNAFYNPEFDNLMFGDVNTLAPNDVFTEDSTVPRHEYVHYLIEKIWPIQNFGQAGAISEAVADYFAASSLSHSSIGRHVVQALGGTGVLRELDCQKDPARCKTFSTPGTWVGEIHDDSEPVAQALWEIRVNRIAALGHAAGRSCVDGLVFESLLYFPESFDELYEGMRRVDAEGRVTACGGASTAQAAINTAFAAHGLVFAAGDAYERNDGFESAVDVSTLGTVAATIEPEADADFWSFGAGPGLVKLTLDLPPSGGFYKGYQLKLHDRSRRVVATAAPSYNGINTIDGLCDQADCTTTQPQVVLQYNNPTGGLLYAQVVGGDGVFGSNSGVHSTTPYGLRFQFDGSSALAGSIVSATFDQDLIAFSVDVASFVSIQDWRFAYAQLRDHSETVLPNTRTDVGGGYLTFVSSASGLGRLTGQARLAAGFGSRFPAAGTVHLEVFGYNVSGSTASLGLSNPLNLTANAVELTAYNNVFNPARGQKATIKYATSGAGRLTVKLYTVTGVLVATLFDGEVAAGKGSLDWDGRNLSGSVAASGIYVVRAEGPGLSKTQKIAIVK
ncbi:MAG: FlgD immunoglobulin-like domain containing protein [Elusimicrobiota bacterium]|nr:FlgD immunoglobulin-like domain containing protein [Elusimicrobiota bacterium]